jgi:hypothetical protein
VIPAFEESAMSTQEAKRILELERILYRYLSTATASERKGEAMNVRPYALALFYLFVYGVPFLYAVKMVLKLTPLG